MRDCVIVGFSNGITKKYIYGASKENLHFLPNLSLSPQTTPRVEMEESGINTNTNTNTNIGPQISPPDIKEDIGEYNKYNIGNIHIYPAVKHICYDSEQEIVIIGYQKEFKGAYNKPITLQHTYLFIFSGEGNYTGEIGTEGEEILAMDIIGSKYLVLILCKGNQLKVFNYMERGLIMDFTPNLQMVAEGHSLLSMRVLPLHPRLLRIYMGDNMGDNMNMNINMNNMNNPEPVPVYPPRIPPTEPSGCEYNLIFMGMENGNILISNLQISKGANSPRAHWNPLNIYPSHKSMVSRSGGTSVHSLWVDPIVDIVVTGDLKCNLHLYEKLITNLLTSDKGKLIITDPGEHREHNKEDIEHNIEHRENIEIKKNIYIEEIPEGNIKGDVVESECSRVSGGEEEIMEMEEIKRVEEENKEEVLEEVEEDTEGGDEQGENELHYAQKKPNEELDLDINLDI